MEKIKIDLSKSIGKIEKELHSQFIEFLGSCIYDGIWVGEDSEIPNIHGLRKDTVEALKKLRPPVIRWPGGCYADTYHWRDGIGARNRRPVRYNENFGTYEIDRNQFGTHEFMELCRLVGAKPWLNVNVKTGSAAEMREWIEYCNRKEKTELAEERMKNGSEEPFDVEYWGIGNEVWAGGGCMTPQSYADEYRKYVSSFPNFVSLDNGGKPRVKMNRIASGPDGNKPEERVEWTKQFFSEMGRFRRPLIDGYDLHFYNWNLQNAERHEDEFDEEGWNRVIEGCFELEEVLREQAELIREGIEALPEEEGYFKNPKPVCNLIVGEWGNWHGAAFVNRPALYQQCTMRDAITTAITLDLFHRNCDIVKMACVAQTVNVLNSLILTEGKSCILTPNYDVFDMYQVHREAQALATEQPKDKKLHLFASEKNGNIYINLINMDLYQERKIGLELPEQADYISGRVLVSDDPHAYNTKDNPDRIRSSECKAPKITEDCFEVVMEPASVRVLCFSVQGEKKD